MANCDLDATGRAVKAGTRWRGALLVTVLSIALAEVSIASAPWGLLCPLSWLMLVPIYGAQTLLIAIVVLRVNTRPTLTALWCAGVVMGLYEAYITHVLWDEPWDERVNEGLLEWPSLLVVAGFWHAFISVLLPILLAEQVLVREPRLSGILPGRLLGLSSKGRWAVLVLAGAVSGGFYATVNPWITPIALGLTTAAVWGVVVFVRRGGQVDCLADALPRGWGVAGLVAMIAAVFALFIPLAVFGGGDGVDPIFKDPVSVERQVAIIALYALFVLLAARNLRHRREAPVTRLRLVPMGWRPAVVYVSIATVAAITPVVFTVVGIGAVWVAGGAVALVMLWLALRGAVRRPTPEIAPSPPPTS